MFVCAHDELRCWIEDVILFPLETTCHPPYKVCWHLRDFITGLPINEQIVNAIYQSRKIIIVFSAHFMESEFCQLELQHAIYRQLKSRTRCLVPMSLNSKLVPSLIKKNYTYLEITEKKQATSKLLELIGEVQIILPPLYLCTFSIGPSIKQHLLTLYGNGLSVSDTHIA